MLLRILFILFVLSVHSQNKELQHGYLTNVKDNLKEQKNLKSLDSALVFWNSSSKIETLTPIQKFKLTRKIASSYQALGFSFKALDFYQKSAYFIEKVVELKEYEKANFYNELSSFYYAISNNKEFKKNLIKVIEIYEKKPKKYAHDLLEVYEKIITNYLEYGAIDSAKLYLQKLKNLSKFINETPSIVFQKFVLADYLYSLRIALIENDFETANHNYNALDNYFGAIRNRKEVLSYYADATNFYAEAIFKTGKHQKALTLLQKSIQIHKKIDAKNSLITVYSYYSYLSREINNYDLAEQAIEEAIFIIEPDNFTDLSGLYINKGIIYFLEKKYAKSELYFDKAHELIKRIANTDFYLLSYNIEISKKYFEIYEKTGNKKLLQKSFESYRYSVKQFQDFYENDLFNPLLAEFKNNITEGLLNLALQSEMDLIEAIELIENIQSKYLLKNFLLNKRIENQELISDLSKIKTLKLKLASSFALNDNLNSANIKNKIENLEKKIVEKYPNFNSIFNPTFNFKTFIEKNTTQIIRYYVTNTTLYAIHIENINSIQVKKIGKISDIKKDISALTLAIKNKDDVAKLSQKVFKYLVQPFKIQSSEITIISNSFLNELPFEILRDDTGAYMVAQFKINYANSLPLYTIQKDHKNSKQFKLAIYQPNYATKDLAVLPFAEKEALYLQDFYAATLFSNENASKKSFIKNASNFNVYHLSMHAIIDQENEEASRLIFNDGNYYFSDFYSQNLPLDLVVLSACETGVGKYIEGEGLMSISRAFTYSGVASTLHSLWAIPDKQAYEVMQLFYANLNKGLSKSEALQQAKMEYLKNCKADELKHPYYWSGFVLNGNSQALIATKNYRFEILGIALIVCIAFLVYYLKSN